MAVTFPALVYKGGGPYLAPGGYYDYKQVADQTAYDAALSAGWKASLSEVVTNPYGILPDPTKTAPGTILSQDGVEYICDGVNWDALSIKDYTAASLPDPASMSAGATVLVDGHAAVVSGGAIKYLTPFRTTWNARPLPSAILPGAELQVTDYGNRKWISDGTNWSPAQGVVILYDLFGLNDGTGHIAQISGATSGTFAIPGGLKIPAGMIRGGAKISVQVEITKVGANGTAGATVTLGTLNSASDSSISGQTISIGTGMQALMSCAARFGTSTTKFNTRDYVGEGVSQASVANVMKDRTTNIDTSVDMYVNININSANTGDAFNLISVQVKLEA